MNGMEMIAVVLEGLKPADVLRYFEELTRIPRESGHEQAVSDYLVAFAKEQGLDVIQEPCMNVIIKKPASPGYEQAPGVILQGHMDMVCVKEDDLDFDFETQPLPIYVDGDWIRTRGTTLGADNGIAVAMGMAALADKSLAHPELTLLVTVEEETGMDGVLNLNPANVSGKILLNLDSGVEGEALVSCAGGVRNFVKLPLSFTELAGDGLESYDIVIAGLKGGHSGVEINQNRANANKLMGRLMEALKGLEGLGVFGINGGEKDNAISKRAVLGVTVPQSAASALQEAVAAFEARTQVEFQSADPGITVTLEPAGLTVKVLDAQTQEKAMAALLLLPFGPQTMSHDIPGLVESSSNPGTAVMTQDQLVICNAIRSSVKSLKDALNEQIAALCRLIGAENELVSDYPAWPYSPVSPIRDLVQEVYKRQTGEEIRVEAIHAGLECGFLAEKLGDIDMISMGPTMVDIHTPKEALSISSTERLYAFLVELLKEIK